MSPYHLKKEDERDHLKNALRNYFGSSDISPTMQIRYRPPFIQTNTHDARGDAISLAFESMSHRNFSLWSCYILAYNFADLYADELGTGKVPFTEDYKVIDANLWCKNVTECFERYIKELAKGMRDLPEMPEEMSKCVNISHCAQKNRKPKMEDRHIILPSLALVKTEGENVGEKGNDAFFGVFDGHHGAECAAYASAHFVECLCEALSKKGEDIEAVLKDAFDRIDQRITARCEKENIKSGTTASCVYLEGSKTAYLAWCGDSSIGVLHSTDVETISTPHKPEDPEEMKRIEEAGGMVVNINGVPRLNGVLNLSRSLGDIRAKPMVSPKPDVRTYPLSEHDHILFLSSDGVWDSLEEEEIYEFVRTFVATHPVEDYPQLAEFIMGKAKETGACDNLTLICVFIKPPDEVWTKFGQSAA